LVDALRLQGISAAATLEDMSTVLQRMAVLQAVPGLADQVSDDPDTPVITELSQAMSADVTQLLYSLCLHGRTELGLAPDEYAALTMVLLRLLAFQPQAGAAEKKSPELSARPAAVVPSSVTRPRTAAPARPATPEVPTTHQQAAPTPVLAPPDLSNMPTASDDDWRSGAPVDDQPPWEALEDLPPMGSVAPTPPIRSLPVVDANASAGASRTEVLKRPQAPLQTTPEGDFWYEVVQQLLATEAVTALVRELALQSQLLDRGSDVWRLCVDSESLARPATCERLQAAVQAVGHAVRLQFGPGAVTDSPSKRNAQAASARMDAAIELIQNDPLVQSLVQDWGAKIVPGSIQPL
jgi:DNA polymerase-3 subunit gamma/tau